MVLTPRFQFGDISGVESCSFSLSRGVQPSVCTVSVPSGLYVIDRVVHPMIFSDGNRTLKFENCIINDVSPSVNGDGSQSLSIAILDRRWKWRFGQISGRYNIRMASGLIESGTKRSVRKLMELCFAAMGERQYSLRLVPEDVYPHVDWDMEPPSAALEQLCQAVNCHVCLGHDDIAYVFPDGYGKDIPDVPSSSTGVGFNFGVLPGQIGAASAPMMWQLDFRLVPVGLDLDGSIRPIDQLSYAPAYGSGFLNKFTHWHFTDPSTMATVDRRYRKFAKETVWRWFRIERPPNMKKMPVADLEIVSSRQFFPLLDHQLAYDVVNEIDRAILGGGAFDPDARQRRPQQVWGVFYDDGGTGADNTEVSPSANVPGVTAPFNPALQNLDSEAGKKLIYGKSFTVDNELRVIKFADPVYRIKKIANRLTGIEDSYWGEPELYLRTACNFYHPTNRAAYRLQKRVPIRIAPDASLIDWSYREDVVPEWFQTHLGVVEFNQKEVEQSLDYYLQYQLTKYQERIPAHIEVPWLLPYSPDGRIAQVIFEIDGQGFLKTKIHRELEGLNSIVDYKSRMAEVRRFATEQRLARQYQQQDRKKGKQ